MKLELAQQLNRAAVSSAQMRVVVLGCIVATVEKHLGKPFKKRFTDDLKNALTAAGAPFKWVESEGGTDAFKRLTVTMPPEFSNESLSWDYQAAAISQRNLDDVKGSLGHARVYAEKCAADLEVLPMQLELAEAAFSELQKAIDIAKKYKSLLNHSVSEPLVKEFNLSGVV